MRQHVSNSDETARTANRLPWFWTLESQPYQTRALCFSTYMLVS